LRTSDFPGMTKQEKGCWFKAVYSLKKDKTLYVQGRWFNNFNCYQMNIKNR